MNPDIWPTIASYFWNLAMHQNAWVEAGVVWIAKEQLYTAVALRKKAPLSQIAKDFGTSESCLHRWVRRAEIEDGVRELSGGQDLAIYQGVSSVGAEGLEPPTFAL